MPRKFLTRRFRKPEEPTPRGNHLLFFEALVGVESLPEGIHCGRRRGGAGGDRSSSGAESESTSNPEVARVTER